MQAKSNLLSRHSMSYRPKAFLKAAIANNSCFIDAARLTDLN
jgi:hypothetical protein